MRYKKYIKNILFSIERKTFKRESKYRKIYNDLYSCVEDKKISKTNLNPLAIITTYNDHDIINDIINRNIEQGFDLILIDNWSSDGTWSIIQKLERENKNIKRIIRYPESGPSEHFVWSELLKLKSKIAFEYQNRWILHQDSDELTISMFDNYPVGDVLDEIHAKGFNCVSLRMLDFQPVNDNFTIGDPVENFTYYHFSSLPFYDVQNKIWYQGDKLVDLASSGGHEAIFVGRKVFPIRFPRFHYSVRSVAHAKSKFCKKRMDRASLENKTLGWHSHLDIKLEKKIIYDKSELIRYNRDDLYEIRFIDFINYKAI